MAGAWAKATPGTSSTLSAIGHVNVTSNRTKLRCTGTRIAPGLVLTAAFCVFNFEKNQPFEPQNIHFVAGVDQDKNLGHSTAKCVIFPETLDQQAEGRINSDLGKVTLPESFLQNGMALIALAEDTDKAAILPVAPVALAKGTPVKSASYLANKRQKLTVTDQCQVTGERGNLRSTSCKSGLGGDGGPVLIDVEGEAQLAGITVLAGTGGSSMVLPISIWPDMPESPQCTP